ncbi:hypothetical protein AcW1_002672 [Taiwanofungus camphoratus]|nr:hypothetical protein AcW1_002672 [Antrodia cinnamomea]
MWIDLPHARYVRRCKMKPTASAKVIWRVMQDRFQSTVDDIYDGFSRFQDAPVSRYLISYGNFLVFLRFLSSCTIANQVCVQIFSYGFLGSCVGRRPFRSRALPPKMDMSTGSCSLKAILSFLQGQSMV